MSDDEDTQSTTTDMSVSNYKAEIKFLKSKTELEINNIKKILTSLPPKNIRSSRKDLTTEEIKQRVITSNRIYLSRKNNLNRLQKLTEELDTYEDIINDVDLKRIEELTEARKDLINSVNTQLEEEHEELKEEQEELKEDLLEISDDNTELQAKINQLLAENEELLTENEKLKNKVYIQSPAQNYIPHYNYEIPSTMFKPQQQARYINNR